jgi:hypothetical protein
MTTTEIRSEPVAGPRNVRPVLRMDRLVLGLLVVSIGALWLVDEMGADVPWRVVPPAALIVVGIALLVTLAVGGGRTTLIWLGVGLLAVSVALGIGAQRYAAPAGDVSLAPAAEDWPMQSRLSVGNVKVDLTAHPLPDRGRLDVHLGAGNVTLLVPGDADVRVDVTVTAGTIVIDGSRAADGLDLTWTNGNAADVVITVDVGAGQVEVRHG